jgi:hypothetical protein
MSDWIVDQKAVIGTSPIILPDFCVDCGRPASTGTRIDSTLHWSPGWIWIGIFWGFIPIFLLYYAARRGVDINYSLCALHARSIKLRKRAALATTAAFVAVLAAAIGFHYLYAGFAALAIFVIALIMWMAAGSPLRAAGHEDGVFGIKGFDKHFLAAAAGRSPSTRAD